MFAMSFFFKIIAVVLFWVNDQERKIGESVCLCTLKEGEEYFDVILLVILLWCVLRPHRLGGIKSWEVQLKANEAEQMLFARKTIQYDSDGTSTSPCAAAFPCQSAQRCLTGG